jgi:hypothetical protein
MERGIEAAIVLIGYSSQPIYKEGCVLRLW